MPACPETYTGPQFRTVGTQIPDDESIVSDQWMLLELEVWVFIFKTCYKVLLLSNPGSVCVGEVRGIVPVK